MRALVSNKTKRYETSIFYALSVATLTQLAAYLTYSAWMP